MTVMTYLVCLQVSGKVAAPIGQAETLPSLELTSAGGRSMPAMSHGHIGHRHRSSARGPIITERRSVTEHETEGM